VSRIKLTLDVVAFLFIAGMGKSQAGLASAMCVAQAREKGAVLDRLPSSRRKAKAGVRWFFQGSQRLLYMEDGQATPMLGFLLHSSHELRKAISRADFPHDSHSSM
jgi:hypothetical protein